MDISGKEWAKRQRQQGLPADEIPEDRRGDQWQERKALEEHAEKNGDATVNGQPKEPVFPEPIPASQLRKAQAKPWLWRGYLGRGDVALFSALWKAGKTTLLAHLLRSFETGGKFCGLDIAPARVLYVTEESETRWAERRDALGIQDHVEFLVRPFRFKARWDAWFAFLGHLRAKMMERQSDVVILDTISNLWPVRDENDASQVQSALQPLHWVAEADAGLWLVHHNRKSDGEEATAARGSGALMGFVDTIIELRRFQAADKNDRRRVLTAYGRDDETPKELVVELADEGFSAIGDRREASNYDLFPLIAGTLPKEQPGMSWKEVLDEWPTDSPPGERRLRDALQAGADSGWWQREGDGRRGSPWTYWKP